MHKITITFGLLILFILLVPNNLPTQSAPNSMINTFGTDFSHNFGLIIDLNAQGNPPPAGLSANTQVLQDLGNVSNSKANPVDTNPFYDQQFFFTHFNVSGVDNIFLGLSNLEFNITFPIATSTVNDGHINGTAPYQTLLQYFKNNGRDVLVANTFRGLVAYTTTATNGTINVTDNSYFGYSFIEQHLLNLLNSALVNYGFAPFSQFGYEPLYFPNNNTFGMEYTNYFVVWQNTPSQAPAALSSYAGNAFQNVATGSQMVAASLFKYLKVLYNVIPVVQNSTTTIVNCVTRYELGPMQWFIVSESASTYASILSNDVNINSSNSFNIPATNIQYILNTGLSSPLPSQISVTTPIPNLSFYTGPAVSERTNAAAVSTAGVTGMSLAFVSSTNAMVEGSTVNTPPQFTNSQNSNIQLSYGSTNFFSTNFIGKSTYYRILNDGSIQANLPIFITTRQMSNLSNILDTYSLASSFFQMQDLQSIGLEIYSSDQLSSGLATAVSTGLNVNQASYISLIQIPEWSGLGIVQDPTYSVIATRNQNTGSSTTSTSSKSSTATGSSFSGSSSTSSTTQTLSNGSSVSSSSPKISNTPGFETTVLMLAFVVFIVWKKNKKT